ncbi:succinyl-diaminopimelate desuccinylase [Aliiglaciecola sp. CAU 1673]|uniref:succinyl-diaminopimelate desuccinylase n=1 Tax=Aliiglaciecola sp. CAU 1673 TaxID=3032595 RepID=UPI0023DC6721|nr:succinyl-diaminopimelate desuccinylase [Aliiglaciecola sp. CAU 1673]MDF2178248.1 succinyl-diaminopimelate desuccinylase [Aliiglaciecola sp. CAU 1673]
MSSMFASSPVQAAKSIDYSQELIRRPSVTPNDHGCQQWLAQKLEALGFDCLFIYEQGVSNLVASRGHGEEAMAFVGHTDVVPPGPLDKWKVDPFAAAIVDDELIGRGAADMKTGVAAMLAALERHILTGKPCNKRMMWLITSDEEGEAEYGSKVMKRYLDSQGVHLDYCIVGEPTAKEHSGDVIKVGRRGAISARLRVKGKQGHVAYPQYADNAIHKMGKLIAALNSIVWDEGSDDFPGTSMQITHIDSGAFTDNIVPANCSICFNIRYSHRYSQQSLFALIESILSPITQDFELEWERPCEPYFTEKGDKDCLIEHVEKAIHKTTGTFPLLSTSGGTSDGRFFASPGTQVVEVGVPNKSIHQVNERVHIAELVTLEDIYSELLESLLA